jgi:hypothetical protein
MSVIFKQLCINSLLIPEVIQEEIKQYAFHDFQLKMKKIKNQIFKTIKDSDRTRLDGQEHWAFSLPNIQFQACNCATCGGFTMTSDAAVLMALNSRTLCSCDGFRDIHTHNAAVLGYLYNPNLGRFEYNYEFDQANNQIGQLEEFNHQDYLEFLMEEDQDALLEQQYQDWLNGPNHDEEHSYYDSDY